MNCFAIRILIFCISFGSLSTTEIDYCAAEYCKYQGQHVRCGNNGEFSSACVGEYKLEDLTPYIDLILYKHNYYRNLVASGHLEGFPPAVRMPAITSWNNELAANAAYNVMSCEFAHDSCRSTLEFPYAGQNIYYSKTTNLNKTVSDFINQAINMWFDEYKYANAELIRSFHKTDPPTGHFTVLVNDRQNTLGCAFLNDTLPSTTTGKAKRVVIFTCDYPSTNIRGVPTYEAGTAAATECKKVNAEFTALCDDPIDPNDISWYKSDS